MSWLFEQTAPSSCAHELFLDLAPASPRQVSLLEFLAMDAGVAEVVVSAVVAATPQDDLESQAQERVRAMAAMIDAAREEAREEMRTSLLATMSGHEAECRKRVELITLEFARDRQRFFAAAENHVVQLALAVARQVLAREMAVDPMHLAGAVHAALRKVEDEIGTVLRTPLSETDAWRALLNTPGGTQVQVVGSDQLQPGECVLETTVGRIELSAAVQMAEIERGFEQVMPRQGR